LNCHIFDDMNEIDLLNEIKNLQDPRLEEMLNDSSLWRKFARRHKAGIFEAIFMDKDDIKDDDIKNTIRQVAEFFELPMPVVQERAETMAEVITSDHADGCQFFYDWQEMENSGINNRDALKLACLHELAHQYLYSTRFLLFENELWIQELAADLLVGGFSILNDDVATGKYKYVVSQQNPTLTHPDGKIREEIVVYGRSYAERLKREKRYHGIRDLLAGLPAFVYSHYKELQEAWDLVSLEEAVKEPEPPAEQKPTDWESLPDTNLLKQYMLKHKKEKKKEDEK